MLDTLAAKEAALIKFLQQYKRPALAFSGGVDSSALLAVAKAASIDIQPILADTTAIPQFEKDDAKRVTQETQSTMHCIAFDPLTEPGFRSNPPDRCYHCKKALMTALKAKARELGCDVLLDGANTDDIGDYRPGMQAAHELGIVSPLLACGLSKADVRALATKYNLSVAHKPAYACLASRIAYGEEITAAKLRMVEKAEDGLRALCLGNVRVRCHGSLARIEVTPELIALLASGLREKIVSICNDAGFTFVTLDLEGYRTGSLNSVLKKASDK